MARCEVCVSSGAPTSAVCSRCARLAVDEESGNLYYLDPDGVWQGVATVAAADTLPSGGDLYDLLVKQSLTDSDAAWASSLHHVSIVTGALTDPYTSINVTATWNDAADTFSLINAVVTNTASAAASTVIKILGGAAGATNLITVDKSGNETLGGSITATTLVVTTGQFMSSSVALTDGAAAATGTLTNAPAAGNPTKWIPIDDNGTTRYIPAW